MTEIAPLIERLIHASVAACTCQVESPYVKRHDPMCHYRLFSEAAATLMALPRNPQWASKIRFERTDHQRYVIYLGDSRLGTIERMDDRQWHARNSLQRKQIFHTRGEAADWLRREGAKQDTLDSLLRDSLQCGPER